MITAERNRVTGAWLVSALVAGEGMRWYERRQFYGYTKREAIDSFRAFVEQKNWELT